MYKARSCFISTSATLCRKQSSINTIKCVDIYKNDLYNTLKSIVLFCLMKSLIM